MKIIATILLVIALVSCAISSASEELSFRLENSPRARDNTRTIIMVSPVLFSGSNAGLWEAMEDTLDTTTASKVVIYWQGYGGLSYLGMSFIHSMIRAEARGVIIDIKVVGFSASMHAIVPCYATTVERGPQGILMFHLRANLFGVDHTLDSQQDSDHLMQGCVEKGILKQEDISKVQQGKELYILPNNQVRTAPDSREEIQ